MTSFWQKIKRHGTSIAFVLGFIWDNIMLTRVDHLFANVMLGSYLGLSAISIVAMNIPTGTGWHMRIIEKTARWLPFILQFCFGSLFSAYLVLYTRSASLATNWPFLFLLVVLTVSNELFRKKYASITLPLSVFFIVLFSYITFSLPTFLGSMGSEIFIVSGFVSLFVMIIFSRLISLVSKEKFKASRLSLAVSIVLIYILFNVAYFTNIIPPIPLALKEIGVYHSVTRFQNGVYALRFEPGWWYPFTSATADVFNRKNNEPVYVWSAIFAPTKLTVPVFHRWQYYEESRHEWITTDLIQFPIVGGRDGGYRGYSMKAGVFPARWRVDVETIQKKLIGRVEFIIKNISIPQPNLVIETR